MSDQAILGIGLVTVLALFVWGRWRYDLVAMMTLLALALAGVVAADRTFSGFGHPAVITVAAVLVVSRGLRNSGAVNVLGRAMRIAGEGATGQALTLTLITAVCSGFMNNVGALAIIMPVAVQMARAGGRSPSFVLMPIAFGSLLGGMVTLIGTPPNIIIAAYRAEVADSPYDMFSFTPVGAGVAVAGCVFCGLVGWRLLPKREPASSADALFDVDAYVVELRVPKGSKAEGMTIGEVGDAAEGDAVIAGIAHGDRRLAMPSRRERIAAGDVLVVEADAETITALTGAFGLELDGDRELRAEMLGAKGEITVVEAIVTPGGTIEGRSAAQIDLRRRAGINILGVAREGRRIRRRLRDIRLRGGDVLLLQGNQGALQQAFETLGLLPLAQRDLGVGKPRRALLAVAIFAAGVLATVLGLAPVEVAFAASACAMLLARLLSLREAYEAIDWPVIVLLGAMIPVGEAMQTTGAAGRIAAGLLGASSSLPAWGMLLGLMVVTMLLSNVINNAAAAVLMAPIAVRLAEGMGSSVDPFLMGVAVAASSAFLTPIGHQSNTLVMGPGGYRFGDYWRLGLPVSVIVLAVSAPMILLIWPV
ncbi:MAG: SLC13 family permease [Leptolyngbya sp. PLA2]|nr:SLC13 family permease [Leptolyngbya sp.]MCE7971845.1 SLC13 family permease [Leptolyngbya sp. PL-A2]MCZ7634486.1 SLC13 family permease [Phycisphaerales bacterium]MDL1904716.1 SLC13 family permease [Synechococcales cyanobacterium CNB]GIK19802.1 MAG: SLC13 family permease [Planctomycetota bacterium]